jgi:hypothetical protein
MFMSVGAGLAAVYWLDRGTSGLFAAIADGFCIYAALTVATVLRVKDPAAIQRVTQIGSHMRPIPAMAGLATALLLGVPTQTVAGMACKPVLSFQQVRFSEAQNQLRKWTGVLAVDASRCVATSGTFEIKFVRSKEVGLDLLFSERFQWSPGLTQVSLDFWWDEAVLDYWIGDVPSCACPE